MARKYAGDGEFSGGPGPIQRWKIDNDALSGVDDVWSTYATNPACADEPDARNVGRPEAYRGELDCTTPAQLVSGIADSEPVRRV